MHKVEEKFFVAGQIFPSDIKSLKEQGFQTIVCNRPNGEEEGQPIYAEIEKTCKENDIKCFFIPISPGEIDPAKVFELNSIIQEEKRLWLIAELEIEVLLNGLLQMQKILMPK